MKRLNNRKGQNYGRRLVKSSYQAPPPSRWKRLLHLIFNPWTAISGLVVLLIAILTFAYFWQEYSDRIDRKLLSGDVFTPTAGIYSSPKRVRIGDNLSVLEAIEYLRSAGYVEKNNRADQARSRFSIEGRKLLIEPGATGVIDGVKIYPSVSVTFSADGRRVESIINLRSGQAEKAVFLEPKMLSTIAAEGDGRRRTVSFADLPPHLIRAITVTEDRSFFEHYGVNFRGILRALWRRYEGDEDSPIANQGGSSITQQLVKNLFLTREPTLERKLKEAFMSLILETRLSKEEIFTLYVNQIYLGQQSGVSIYGVGEAANAYFGKDVSQLNLAESAFIASIIRSPNRYNPYKNQERATERRNQVLDSMLETAVISPAEHQAARSTPLSVKPISGGKDLQGMPYFSQYVIEQLPGLVSDPEALQHLRVYTSIDPDLQRIAYETVSRRLEKLDKLFPKRPKGSLNAALVAIKPKTGEIVAMVGGRDYLENQFNRATDAMRQPGSVFKPFVYTAAINSAYDAATRVFTAASIFKDEKKVFAYGNETYSPNNFGDYFSNREMTLRDALVMSKNNITVDLAMQLNVGRVMNLAAKAGLPKVEKAYPSMALGTAEATPLQVASAYTMFANLGDSVAPLPITSVTAGDGRTLLRPSAEKRNVVRPEVAYIIDDILKDVINRGTAAKLGAWGFRNESGRAFAGKTGTSRDGWFAGFTPEIVCVVYVGFDDGSDLGMKGSDSAMPIWADFMQEAIRKYPEWIGDWPIPPNIRKAEIDIRNGSLIREIGGADTTELTPTPTPLSTPEEETDPAWQTEIVPETQQTEPETDVPKEFRRIELFIAGTLPPKIPYGSGNPSSGYDPLTGEPLPNGQGLPSPTPLDGTWEDKAANPSESRISEEGNQPGMISVSICPDSGLRARINCPNPLIRQYRKGSEPTEFCPLHR